MTAKKKQASKKIKVPRAKTKGKTGFPISLQSIVGVVFAIGASSAGFPSLAVLLGLASAISMLIDIHNS